MDGSVARIVIVGPPGPKVHILVREPYRKILGAFAEIDEAVLAADDDEAQHRREGKPIPGHRILIREMGKRWNGKREDTDFWSFRRDPERGWSEVLRMPGIQPHRGRVISLKRPVMVHRNLNMTSRQGGPVYTVVQRAAGGRQLVVAHAIGLTLAGNASDPVRFIVSPAGRERARREGRKNVHAYVQGMLGFGALGALAERPGRSIVRMGYDHRDDLGFRSLDPANPMNNVLSASAARLDQFGLTVAFDS